MLFSILIFDEPDTAALRDEYRQRHLDYLKEFDAQTMFAGPFVNDDESADIGSLRLIEFETREEASTHVENEPYVIGGVQKRWFIHRWEPALTYTWRDCPRTEGNIQALFHGLDNPTTAAQRKSLVADNQDYLNFHEGAVMSYGPMLSDDGETELGDTYLLDAPDMAELSALKNEMPFVKADLYHDQTFHRWRFGRVFDRFKV